MGRDLRIISKAPTLYHFVSRTFTKDFVFDSAVIRDDIIAILYRAAEFSGFQIFNYVIMSNHFHVLAFKQPKKKHLSDIVLLDRLAVLWNKPEKVEEVRERLKLAHAENSATLVAAIRKPFLKRMGHPSQFMKTFKEMITRYIRSLEYPAKSRNAVFGRRFYSIIVEQDLKPVIALCAYIELNPIRAGIATSIDTYESSCYARALRGNERDLKSIHTMLTHLGIIIPITEALETYRRYLSPHIDSKFEGTEERTPLPLENKISYFTTGRMIGSEASVKIVCKKNATKFGNQLPTLMFDTPELDELYMFKRKRRYVPY